MSIQAPSVTRTPRSGSDFERIYDALVAYKNIHGDVKVPQKFKITSPSTDFPVEMWGMNLGKTLHNIRYKHCHASYKPRLLELGVDYEIIRKKPRRVGPNDPEYEEQRRKAMKVAINCSISLACSYLLLQTNSEFDQYDPNDFLSSSPKNDMSFSGLVPNYDSDDSDLEDDALDRAYNQVTGNTAAATAATTAAPGTGGVGAAAVGGGSVNMMMHPSGLPAVLNNNNSAGGMGPAPVVKRVSDALVH